MRCGYLNDAQNWKAERMGFAQREPEIYEKQSGSESDSSSSGYSITSAGHTIENAVDTAEI